MWPGWKHTRTVKHYNELVRKSERPVKLSYVVGVWSISVLMTDSVWAHGPAATPGAKSSRLICVLVSTG